MIFADYETRGVLDLPAVGAYEYIQHPLTEILMVGVSVDGHTRIEDRLVDVGTYRPFASWGPFDRHVYQFKEGQDPIGWVDVQALALMVGLPKSLEAFCRSVGIEAKKDPRGTRLINTYSKPQKDGSFLTLSGDERKAFEEYCLQDVVLLEKAWKVLGPLYPEWRKTHGWNYEIVDKMNTKGVPIDQEAVENALAFIQARELNLTFEFRDITGLSPSQSTAVAQWFGLPDVRRETLINATFDDPTRQKARDIRLELASASIKKLKPMLEASQLTGRVRGCFISNGAHTGRCTSHLVQFQNMKRAKIHEPYFEALHRGQDVSEPIVEAQNNIRGFIKPPKDHVLVVADYAQVEARVLAWQANDIDLLNIFTAEKDPYTMFAAEIFKLPVESIAKDSKERQLGKIDILGSGYGVGGPGLARQALGYGVHLTEKEAWALVRKYRDTFGEVPRLWHDYEVAAKFVVEGLTKEVMAGRCNFSLSKSRQMLIVELPSGRKLRYAYPKVQDGFVTYTARLGVNTTRKKLWGGHITENLCQAVAADLKFNVMAQFPDELIMEVHDEIVLEVPESQASRYLEDLIARMECPPHWFTEKGLIKAEGTIMKRYSK